MRKIHLDIMMMTLLLIPVTFLLGVILMQKSNLNDIIFMAISFGISIISWTVCLYEIHKDELNEFKDFGWYSICVMPGLNVVLTFMLILGGGVVYILNTYKKFREGLK